MARSLTGVVSSAKGNKTITVSIHTRKSHPLYRKHYSVTTKFLAHDEANEAQEGDTVTIVESRPISARKHFTLKSVVRRAAIRAEDSVDAIDPTESKEEDKGEEPKEADK